ncbi:MAG: BtpA/SgcQ family protein [Pseudomonadota bacterium]
MDFKDKSIIAMIHVPALPGTPKNSHSIDEIVAICLEEASVFDALDIETIMIENMHDLPYEKSKVSPEITASMAVVARELKNKFTDKKFGIQILAGANKEALAVAQAADFNFIRAEGFVFGHLADEGYIDSCASELMRYRKNIRAESIKILTDIKKKHSSHSITADLDISEVAKAAQFFLSDAVIITGSHTGCEPSLEEIKKVKQNLDIPVILGSGLTEDNIEKYYYEADAFIVGSFFKEDGIWSNGLDKKRIEGFLSKVRMLKGF